jgi:hypothetical protein
MRAARVLTAVVLLSALAAAATQAQETKPTAMSHDAEGRANCMMCHSGSMPNVAGVPTDHEGRVNETCLWCHAADAAIQTTDPTTISHTLEGRDNCMMCHAGAMPNVPGVPEDHEGRANEACSLCHKTGG